MALFTDNTSDTDLAYKVVGSNFENFDEHTTEMFRDGFDHTVIVVDGTTAFRFAKNQEYLDKLPVVSKFLKEFSSLSPVSIPVSEILYHNDIPYEKYNFLPGQPLKIALSNSFSPEQLVRVAKEIGTFLSALHSFPVTQASNLGIPPHAPLEDWSERYASIRRHIHPMLNEQEKQWIDDLFNGFLPLLSAGAIDFRVTHFDIKPDHIIVHPDTKTLEGIIDFGDMRIGDPAYDFTFFAQYSPDLTPYVLEAYSLAIDDTFMHRVRFYQDVLPVVDLDHALEIGAHKKIDEFKKSLSDYIAASHLL